MSIDDDGGIRNSSASIDPATGRVRTDATKRPVEATDIQAMIEGDVAVVDANPEKAAETDQKRHIDN